MRPPPCIRHLSLNSSSQLVSQLSKHPIHRLSVFKSIRSLIYSFSYPPIYQFIYSPCENYINVCVFVFENYVNYLNTLSVWRLHSVDVGIINEFGAAGGIRIVSAVKVNETISAYQPYQLIRSGRLFEGYHQTWCDYQHSWLMVSRRTCNQQCYSWFRALSGHINSSLMQTSSPFVGEGPPFWKEEEFTV
jgi:hypothetical protein